MKDSVAVSRKTGPLEGASRVRLWLLTALGLAIGFDLIPNIISAYFGGKLHQHLPLRALIPLLITLLIWLADPALLILWVRRVECRPLRALGLAKPSLLDFGLGFGAFAIGRGVTFLFGYGVLKVDPDLVTTSIGPLAALMRLPLWIGLSLAVFAGFSEELVARGYAIERFERITGSTLIAAALALLIDLALHIQYWGRYYPLLILPVQAMLVLLFLWRRNLQPCIIAHILFDASPFLMMAMMPGAFLDLQGVAFYQEHNYARAEQEFGLAIKYNPHDRGALLGRGESYLNERKYDPAVTDLSGAIGIKPSATAYYDRMRAYIAKRDYTDGQLDLGRAITADPVQANHYKENYYSARASTESDDDNNEAAIKDWTAAIKFNPKNIGYHRSRGFNYMGSHHCDEALADFSSVIQSKPGEPDGYVERATLLSIGGDFRRARADYDTAIHLSPRNPYYYIGRSGIESAAGDHADAVSDIETAIKLKLGAYGYYRLGAEFMDWPRPDFGKAIGALSIANDLSHGTDADTLDMLASACAGVGDYMSAVRFENEAISHADPDVSDDIRKEHVDTLHKYERAVRVKAKNAAKLSARKSKPDVRRGRSGQHESPGYP